MAAPDPVADRALALAASSGGAATATAVAELAGAADRPSLERAQQDLVRRIRQRSDDYEATEALGLVNRALAELGWEDPYSWKHRRKP